MSVVEHTRYVSVVEHTRYVSVVEQNDFNDINNQWRPVHKPDQPEREKRSKAAFRGVSICATTRLRIDPAYGVV